MGVMGLLQRLCPAAQGPADHEDEAEKSTEAVGPACPTAAPTGAGPGGEPAWVEARIPPPLLPRPLLALGAGTEAGWPADRTRVFIRAGGRSWRQGGWCRP